MSSSSTPFIVGLNHDRNQPLSKPIQNKKLRSRGTQTLKENQLQNHQLKNVLYATKN